MNVKAGLPVYILLFLCACGQADIAPNVLRVLFIFDSSVTIRTCFSPDNSHFHHYKLLK